ncbi:MAG: hypothetical protein H7329_15050, partial [Opitutaceae bacterium]|nr:hypothetical protein [Cytophagales bacterium]
MVFSELLIAPIVIGMSHSIETDHVLALGNLMEMKKSNAFQQAYKGASWGLGHTISVAIGVLLIEILKNLRVFQEELPLEVFAGILLVLIGSVKIWRWIFQSSISTEHKKKDFFHIGLVHGLAGSGTIAILLSG